MNNIVIGIEGLVGSGKTSICRELLTKVPNSIILHGGNLYRGIVYALIQNNAQAKNDISSLKDMLKNVDITIIMEKLNVDIKLENNETVVYIGDKKIDEEDLQSDISSMGVSIAGKTANNENLYIFGKTLIDMYKKKYNVIVSGRDLMKIYPELDYHFFITASLEERVNRKMNQYNNEMNKEELMLHIKKRDELQEQSGFYKIYDNTIIVDATDCKNVEESTEKVLKNIKLVELV